MIAAVLSPEPLLGPLARRWRRLELSQRYALASLPVLLVFTLGLGWWMTRAIEAQVIDNTAVNVALYVQSFVAPELQGLALRDHMTEGEIYAVEHLLRETPLGQKILSFKVWKEGGKVVYYSRNKLSGAVFEPTENIRRAWQGEVRAEFEDLADEEDAEEARLGAALLEVYSPVRERGSDRIIAVAEFYQDADPLRAQLARTRLRTWLVVVLATLIVYGLLFGIVNAGGRLIRSQRELLRRRVDELSFLLAQNEELSLRVRRATRRATELNERFLRRVSADLHDGPAQSLGLALLRLDTVEERARRILDGAGDAGPGAAAETFNELREALHDALTEVREISRGLSLPELNELDILDTLRTAAVRHRLRTGTDVALVVDALHDASPATSLPVRLTVYRLVQEALMNAFRHAGGAGQGVRARVEDEVLVVQVTDTGGGFDPGAAEQSHEHLGLRGLRERVESLGGRFEITSAPGAGTTVTGHLPLEVSGE